MIKIIPALFIFAFGTVLASARLIFDADFIAGKNNLISHVNFATHIFGSGSGKVIRFLHFIPKLGSDIAGDFGSRIGNFDPKIHALIKLDAGEFLDAFTGFSDCHSWLAFHIRIWNPTLFIFSDKFTAFIKDANSDFKEKTVVGAIGLADFLFTKIDRAIFEQFHKKNLATTHLTLALLKVFGII